MSEQNRKNLLSHIKNTIRDKSSSFQTEYDRLGVNPPMKPVRAKAAVLLSAGGASSALGRRVISGSKTKTLHGFAPSVQVPSVGTHQEYTWSTSMPGTNTDMPEIETSPKESSVSDKFSFKGDRILVEDMADRDPHQHRDPLMSMHPHPEDEPLFAPPVNTQASEEPAPMCSLSQAKPGDYCLLFKGNVVAVDIDPEKIEIFMESLLRTFDNSYPEDLMVFRCQGFKIGAHIE